jgi:hypothetical protein
MKMNITNARKLCEVFVGQDHPTVARKRGRMSSVSKKNVEVRIIQRLRQATSPTEERDQLNKREQEPK